MIWILFELFNAHVKIIGYLQVHFFIENVFMHTKVIRLLTGKVLDFPVLLWYSVGCQKNKEVAHMAKITVKELYYGEKYAVMREVVRAIEDNPLWEDVKDRNAIRELEIVRQTLIASERMKRKGDCIAEGELGGAVAIVLSGGKHEKHN